MFGVSCVWAELELLPREDHSVLQTSHCVRPTWWNMLAREANREGAHSSWRPPPPPGCEATSSSSTCVKQHKYQRQKCGAKCTENSFVLSVINSKQQQLLKAKTFQSCDILLLLLRRSPPCVINASVGGAAASWQDCWTWPQLSPIFCQLRREQSNYYNIEQSRICKESLSFQILF